MYLGLNSIGSPNGLYQYGIIFWPSQWSRVSGYAPTSAAVHIKVTSGEITRQADVAMVFQTQAKSTTLSGSWLFMWEPTDKLVVDIDGVRLEDGSLLPCDAAPVTLEQPVAVQDTWHVDDVGVKLGNDLSPAHVPDEKVLNVEKFIRYPVIAKEEDAQGKVLVAVEVGPDGRLLASWIFQSSGNDSLDQAALTAAKNSTYMGPQLGGNAVAAPFLLEIDFELE